MLQQWFVVVVLQQWCIDNCVTTIWFVVVVLQQWYIDNCVVTKKTYPTHSFHSPSTNDQVLERDFPAPPGSVCLQSDRSMAEVMKQALIKVTPQVSN